MTQKTPYWGNNLKELMDWREMKPSDLARLAGVTEAAVYQWLSKPYPTLAADKASKLQAIFGVPFYKIFPLIEGENNDSSSEELVLALAS